MQFKTLLFCFCGCLLSVKTMASTANNERRQASEQAQQESRNRQREENKEVPTAPGDIQFVKNPKILTIRRGGTNIDM